jgi:hypothetical protein
MRGLGIVLRGLGLLCGGCYAGLGTGFYEDWGYSAYELGLFEDWICMSLTAGVK